MSLGPHASLAVEPPAARSGWFDALRRGVIVPLLHALRMCDPVWPGPTHGPAAVLPVAASRRIPPRAELDSRLLDHFAG